jgi:metal-sulfur cluster biosynthetic enzyme
MLSEPDILTALRDCFDPEVKLNLVDLGLIYSVETGPDPDSTPAWPRQWVKVTMTLTTP